MVNINLENLSKTMGINFNLFRFKKFEHYTFVFENHLVHLALSNMNYAATFFLNIFDYKTNKWIHFTTENLYKHGSFPKIPTNPNHCDSFIFEK